MEKKLREIILADLGKAGLDEIEKKVVKKKKKVSKKK